MYQVYLNILPYKFYILTTALKRAYPFKVKCDLYFGHEFLRKLRISVECFAQDRKLNFVDITIA